MAHIIVVGNEKGGAGKSTVSMHVATALARLGKTVAAIDLDLRQRSFARYVENRHAFLRAENMILPGPTVHPLADQDADALPAGKNSDDARLEQTVRGIDTQYDFILIDCPGSHTRLSQMAHAMADTLITPLNDSFVDFDLLARIDAGGDKILGPSVYSEMVWTARQSRAAAGLRAIDWIVVRNRLGVQRMINKEKMEVAVARLSKRIGFRVAPGFSERVVFRELFPKGLTLLDLRDIGVKQLNMSNIAARQELRDLIKALNLPGVTVAF
jgi:chromosome partitioning protein